MKKIHRFIGAYQLGRGTMRLDDPRLAHQLRSVLKLVPGETIVIGDGSGLEAQCRILGYQPDAVLVEAVSLGRNEREPDLKATLYCAVLKADHFEWAAAKAVEVGVTRIVPVLAARTVKLKLRLDRVEAIVRESAEVAGRGVVPEVRDAVPFDRVLDEAADHDANFFFDPSGKPFSGAPKKVRSAGVFIGPEGGWEESEVERASHCGMHLVSLGHLVLRAETAAAVATYEVVHRRNV